MSDEHLERRDLLALVGAASMSGVAGCFDDENGTPGDDPRSPTESSGTPGQTSTAEANVAITDTSLETREVPLNEGIGIVVHLANTGGEDGHIELTVTADGDEITTETVAVGAGEELEHDVTTPKPPSTGEFELAVNGYIVGEVTVTSPTVLHVALDGDSDNPGTLEKPLASIDAAVDEAEPGDTVKVHPGEYIEFVDIHEPGEPDAPITLSGPPEAVLKPPKDVSHEAIAVGASHIHITGLTITGLYNEDEPENPDSYHSGKLIGLNTFAEGDDDYIEGLVVSPHQIGGAGAALINSIRIKASEIGGFKVIGPAGARWSLDDSAGHNGEIVYLGTAPDNVLEREGFTDYDETRNVRVHHIDNSEGHRHSELVDCKAGTRNITVEYCTDAWGTRQGYERDREPNISMEGHNCTVRWNVLRGARGEGLEFARTLLRDTPEERGFGHPENEFEASIGTDNEVYGNVITEYRHRALFFFEAHRKAEKRVGPEDQRRLCGNVVDGPTDGTPGRECSSEVPEGDGIGHLGGDSPWTDEPGDLEAVYGDIGNVDMVVDPSVQTESMGTNSPLEVETVVRNAGDVRSRKWVEVSVDGLVGARDLVTLDPGEETAVTQTVQPMAGYTVPQDATGERVSVAVNDSPVREVRVESVFEVDTSIRREQVTVGEPIQVDVSVTHTGSDAAELDLLLEEAVVGWKFDSSTIPVLAGGTGEDTLEWDTMDDIRYPLTLNGLHDVGAVVAESDG